MKRNFSRLLSAVLSIVVLAGMLTTGLSAFAADEAAAALTDPADDDHTYYITYGGNVNGGRTPDDPNLSVQQVSQIIKADKDAGIIKDGETVTIKVIQPEDYNTTDPNNPKIPKITPWHNYSGWVHGDWGLRNNTFHITSFDPANPSYLSDTAQMGDNNYRFLNAPTLFTDIVLVNLRNSYNEIVTNLKDVTFGEGTVFARINPDEPWTGEVIEDGKVRVEFGRLYNNDNGQATNRGCITFKTHMDATAKDEGLRIGDTAATGAKKYNPYDRGDLAIEFNCPTIRTNINWGNGKWNVLWMDNPSQNTVNLIATNAELINHVNAGGDTIIGDLQIIANKNVKWQVEGVDAGFDALSSNVQVKGNKYVLILDSENPEAIRPILRKGANYDATGTFVEGFTESDDANVSSAGQYTVADGYLAIATNSETNETVTSDAGMLVLTPGIWNVQCIQGDGNTEYFINGNVFTALKTSSLLYDEITVPTQANKLFIGWTRDEEGTDFIQLEDGALVFNAGDKFYAQYIDFNTAVGGDLSVLGAQIRLPSGNTAQGLRFISRANKALLDNLGITEIGGDTVRYGTVVFPADLLGNAELVIGAADETGTYTAEPVYAVKTYEDAATTVSYTAVIVDVPVENYKKVYAVRSFIEYTDKNGADRVAYGEKYATSIYDVANYAINNDTTLTEDQVVALYEILDAAEAQG